MSVVEWYNGKSIFITGGTGFMGKVLIEKLLRSCPGIDKIYILIRTKRGVSPNTRLQNIFKLPVFQLINDSNPDLLKKIVPIEGDITANDLGMSDKNRKLLNDTVSIVFHSAATLKLEAELRESVMQNLIGTRNLMNLCLGMKKLESLIHLSTAFCHGDIEVLEEKIYPPTRNPDDIIHVVEWMDDEALNRITPNILGPHPNTYTFTKRLAETIAFDMGKKLPVAIMRPSIVIPAIKEPVEGWVDSLNGPVGIIAGAGKGVIRSMMVKGENSAEIIPVDIAANAMIVTAWIRGTNKFAEPPVYNVSSSEVVPVTWGEVLEKGKRQMVENPFDWPLWYPDGDIRTSKITHGLIVFLFQLLPAYFLDFIFFITRQKTFMIRIQNRIRLGMELLQYFTLREWKFKTKKFLSIQDQLNEKEHKMFYISNIDFDIDDYLRIIILGTRQYCMKEDLKNLPRARAYLRFLFILDRFVKFCFFVTLFWYSMYFFKFILTSVVA